MRQREDRDPHGLIRHSNKLAQYLVLRYTQRVAEAGAVASVGSRRLQRQRPGRGLQLAVQAELSRNKDRARTSTTVNPPSPRTSTGIATGHCTWGLARTRA
jgi:hypothetical protein